MNIFYLNINSINGRLSDLNKSDKMLLIDLIIYSFNFLLNEHLLCLRGMATAST